MEPIGGIGFFGVGVGADDKIAVKLIKWVLVRFARSGLLFFTRKRYERKRDKYEQHIARMLQFIERPSAKSKCS
jgi:endothelin-converting enzyme/putative endopeptidase